MLIDQIKMSPAVGSIRSGITLLFLCFHLTVLTGLAQSTITTFVGPPPTAGERATTRDIGTPYAVVPDGIGGFYFASPGLHQVYHGIDDGPLTLVAGDGTAGFGGDGGPAISAKFNNPIGIAVDSAKNIFIADSGNSRIRKVTAEGVITTVAGTGQFGFNGDGGLAVSAQLSNVTGVAVDSGGNLFIADLSNHRVRRVAPDGVITTVAGDGTPGFRGDGGPAAASQLTNPWGVAVDAAGDLFIADTGNHRIRKVTASGIISTVAGNGTAGSSGDAGPATAARLNRPYGVALDVAGAVYIADTGNHRIRKLVAGSIYTIVGRFAGFNPNDEAPISAFLNSPMGVAVDRLGNVYIADTSNRRIRKVGASVIRTVAGSWPWYPGHVQLGADGNLLVTDTSNARILRFPIAGVKNTSADGGTPVFSGLNSRALGSTAADKEGNLFVVDWDQCNIIEISSSGTPRVLVQGHPYNIDYPYGGCDSYDVTWWIVALDATGNLFAADTLGQVWKKHPTSPTLTVIAGGGTAPGGDGGLATSAKLGSIEGLATDTEGNLFVSDAGNHRVLKVSASGIIDTVAGNGISGFSGDDGPAISAQLRSPRGLAVDGKGNLFIADGGDHRIRQVTASGLISTVAGNGTAGFSGDDGLPTSAQLNAPADVAVDAEGNLFIADPLNRRIRKVTFRETPPVVVPSIPRGTPYRGGTSMQTLGGPGPAVAGYARIQPDEGSPASSGLAILGVRNHNILVSETVIPPSSLIQSGRFFAEVSGPVNTGFAIANPNDRPAAVSLFFTDSNGDSQSTGIAIPANGQIAAFLNEPPFNLPSPFSGTLTFSSSVPVAVLALRGLANERAEFLLTTMPVLDLNAPLAQGIAVLPHFADGGGWTTQIILINPTDSVVKGAVAFYDQSGHIATVDLKDQPPRLFSTRVVWYSIQPRGSLKLQTAGAESSVRTGSVRVIPETNSMLPAGVAVFSFRSAGTTIVEAAAEAVPSGSAFQLYAQIEGDFTHSGEGSIQTGFAIANNSASPAMVSLEISELDGSQTKPIGSLSIPGNGQIVNFLNEIHGIGPLPAKFQGILRVSSSSPISVVGIRGRFNERRELLFTAMPAINEAAAAPGGPLFFAHIVDSGGYNTQFILLTGQNLPASSGTIQLFSQSGGPLPILVPSTADPTPTIKVPDFRAD